MIFRFPIFGGLPGRGVLSRIKALLDAHSVALDNVEGEDGISVRKNWKGGLTISASGLASASANYSSFFKLYDASDESDCMIGVTDGGFVSTPPADPTLCGVVYVNGTYLEIPVFESAEITEAGTYHVWLHAWVAADAEEGWVIGENCEVRLGAKDDAEPPDNPHGGLAYMNQLLGRVVVVKPDDVCLISQIVQDYLRGGEHCFYLFGDCLGNAIAEPET